jgi:tRNA(adenine34) deaminase
MRAALKEAEKAKDIDEVPVGCVIVQNDRIIARGHNLKEKKMQAYAHAEMIAIQKASKKMNNWYLDDCDLYVTLEPCMMCTGAIILSRVRNLYYGTKDPKGGAVDSLIQIKQISHLNHHPAVVSEILQPECSRILTDFFREKRKRPKRDPASFRKSAMLKETADTENKNDQNT